MLADLPHDLLVHVMTYLDQDDLLAMSSTASWLRATVEAEPRIWKSVCVHRPGCTSALRFLQRVATECTSLTISSDDVDDITWLLHGIRKEIPESAIDTLYMRAACESPWNIPSNFLHFPLAFPRLIAMRADFHIASDEYEGVNIQIPRNPACASTLRVLVVRDIVQACRRRRVGVFFQGAQDLMTSLNVARLDVRESDFLFRASRRSLSSLRILEYRADDDDHFLTRLAGCHLKKVDIAITDATHSHRLFRQLAYLKRAMDITLRVDVRTAVIPMMLRNSRARMTLVMSPATRIVALDFSGDSDDDDAYPRTVVLTTAAAERRRHVVVRISTHDISRVSIENAHPDTISVVAVISTA
jgi:hypothetical protein